MNSSQAGRLQQQREREQKSKIIVYNEESRGENPNVAESGVKKTTINQINQKCLANIFSHLPPEDRLVLKRVCEKWKEAVALSWRSVKKFDAENLSLPINKRLIILSQLLQKFCQYLTHLTIDYRCFWMTGILKRNCKNIVHFDVSIECTDYTQNLCGIIGTMKKLKYLKVQTHDKHNFQSLWDKLNDILPADIEEIHFFKCKNTPNCESPEIAPALDKFTNLRCLTLKSFRLTTATIESILLNKYTLIYLSLIDCYSADEFSVIFTKLFNLEHLNLAFNGVTDNIIIEITRNSPKLKYLRVDYFYHSKPIQRSTFGELKYLINLEYLEIPSLTFSCYGDDKLTSDVFNNCKKLKYLKLNEKMKFTLSDIQAITKLKKLEYLNLDWGKLDLEIFINIVDNCLELKEFKIIYTSHLSKTALEKITNLKKLERLDLRCCKNLNGNLLSKIVNNCENLIDLNLHSCDNVTEDSLIQVGKLQHLKILCIDWIENVPNEMFFNFRKLEKLSCVNCPSVTDEGIKKVIDNCLNLSYLDVRSTGITVDTLVSAAKRKISYIDVDESVKNEYLSLESPINRLNEKCLVNIFSLFPLKDRLIIQRVCKKWEEAVEMSWHSIKKFDAENLPLNKKAMILKKLLKKFCQHLTHLTIFYRDGWMARVLQSNCKNIVYFDVGIKCPGHSQRLCYIIHSMNKLKYLKVRTRNNRNFQTMWDRLSEILPADIGEIHFLKDPGHGFDRGKSEISSALVKFTNLRCLTLQQFRLTTAISQSILLNKNTLIYLDLDNSCLPEECPTIFTQLVNLEHLNLGCGTENLKYNINMITDIAHNCHKLKYLCVNCFSDEKPLPRSTFSELKYLKNLQHLDCYFVDKPNDGDDNFVRDVFNNCKELKYLNIEGGENFSTLDIQAITKLKKLEYLNLNNAEVDSQLFINIVDHCLELKEFESDTKCLSEIALEKLTNLKKLEKLDLICCENLNGNLLCKIVNNCKNLVDLNLAGCINVTEDSLLQVGKLESLKNLKISEIKNVPNLMFYDFRKLEELSCRDCPTVTDEGIIKVIKHCLELSTLYLGKTGITADTLINAANRKFPLKFLRIFADSSLGYKNIGSKNSRYLEVYFI